MPNLYTQETLNQVEKDSYGWGYFTGFCTGFILGAVALSFYQLFF